MEAARWWAGDRPPDPSRFEVDEDMLGGMAAFGAPPEEIAATRAAMEARAAEREEGATFAVYQDNWRSAQVFLAVSTQWARAGMNGQRMALDYDGVLAWVDRFVPRRRRREVFADLQVMERAVLAVDRELSSDDS